jgi:tetratricopeptide (TPR) repeat protein
VQDCSTLLETAVQLQRSGEFVKAAGLYAEILAIDPNHAQAKFLQGILAHKADHLLTMGICYAGLFDYEKAMNALTQSIALRPQSAEAHLTLGKVLHMIGESRSAIDSCRRALQIDPALIEAHLVLSIALLSLGDYADGWKEYEWRQKWARIDNAERSFSQPQWLGEPLEGRTILLHAEQGFGDTLEFVRYVPLVAEAGGRVILEVHPALYTLLQHTPGAAHCVRVGDPLPDFDLQCPLLSLPLAFGTTLQTIPPLIPLVSPSIAEPAPRVKPRVGLVWAGNGEHKSDGQRSIELKQFAPLWRLADAVEFLSLQKGPPEAQLTQTELPFAIENAVASANDFADTAQIIAGLDLVISVDTAVAHLAGSMLKPVWILIAPAPDWRWGMTGESTPWYPTVRLFRAARASGWTELLERVATELEAYCGGAGKLPLPSFSSSRT